MPSEIVERPKRRRKGWLSRAMMPLLPNWNKYGGAPIRAPTVCGEADEWHSEPRFTAKEYMDNDGCITIGLMVGTDHSQGGRWMFQNYTPDQCVQIVASILSRPAVEKAIGPLLAALRPTTEDEGNG